MPRPKHIDALCVYSFSDLVDMIAERTSMLKTEVRSVLSTFKEVVIDQVSAGNAIRWRRFGVFLPVLRYSTKDNSALPSRIGLVFYPALSLHAIKPQVDVRELAKRGYSGYHYR